MHSDQYRTIRGTSEGLYKEKGSKFIALALPVLSADHAMDELGDIRKKYHDARHHCFAYRLGPDGGEYRYSDDGEPSGTAGRPIYGQLLSTEVTDCMVVVVRYFGGTRLGTGGLATAYKTSAREALDKAKIIVKTEMEEAELSFSYEVLSDVMRIIKDEELTILQQEYLEGCFVRIGIRKKIYQEVLERLSKLHLLEIKTDNK